MHRNVEVYVAYWFRNDNFLQHWTGQHYTTPYFTVLYCTVLYCTVLYFTVLYCTVLYCTVLYFTVLYFTVLYCTLLYCTLLYFTVLHCSKYHNAVKQHVIELCTTGITQSLQIFLFLSIFIQKNKNSHKRKKVLRWQNKMVPFY